MILTVVESYDSAFE